MQLLFARRNNRVCFALCRVCVALCVVCVVLCVMCVVLCVVRVVLWFVCVVLCGLCGLMCVGGGCYYVRFLLARRTNHVFSEVCAHFVDASCCVSWVCVFVLLWFCVVCGLWGLGCRIVGIVVLW